MFLFDAEPPTQFCEGALDAEVAARCLAVDDGVGAAGRRVGDGD